MMWIPMENGIRHAPTALIVATWLPEIAKKVREIRGLNITEAAGQMGIGHATLRRFEERSQMRPTMDTFLAVLAWVSTFTAPGGKVKFEFEQIAREAEEAARG